MKKLSLLFTSLFVYTTVAIPAFAQVTVSPCSTGLNGFTHLCNLGGYGNAGTLIAKVIQILLVAAVIISLVFLIIGGIRWITSGGDKGKLDSARGTVVAAIVGLVIALAAFFIISLVLQVFGLGGLNSISLPQL